MTVLLLGIDGGGSRTRAALADEHGRVVGRGTAGPANLHVVGLTRAVEAVETAIRAARRDAELPETIPIAIACLGLAGAGRLDDRERLQVALAARQLAERIILVSDIELVLAAGCPAGWGIALVSGTGSICLGRAPDGRTARAGGWGFLLGDEGSGLAVALRALRLATQTADGRADAEELLRAALTFWELDAPERLIDLVQARLRETPHELAGFAARVLELAAAGEASAGTIVDEAATDLARHVLAVQERLGLEAAPLALGGSLLCQSALLRERLLARLPASLGPVTLVEDATIGALRLAQQELKRSPTRATR